MVLLLFFFVFPIFKTHSYWSNSAASFMEYLHYIVYYSCEIVNANIIGFNLNVFISVNSAAVIINYCDDINPDTPSRFSRLKVNKKNEKKNAHT